MLAAGAHMWIMYINIIKSLGELSAMAPGRGEQSAHVKIFASCFRSHQTLSIFTACSSSVSIVIIVTTLDNVAINLHYLTSPFSIQQKLTTHTSKYHTTIQFSVTNAWSIKIFIIF